MTLFTYLDNRFKALSLELQKDYTIAKEAELKAAYELIQIQRSFFKWLTMPILFVKYILINLGILNPPKDLVFNDLSKETVVDTTPHTTEVDNLN